MNVADVPLSNPDKVLFARSGFTKRQLVDYYVRVAPVLLPHLRDRPLTLKRYPNGVEAPFFYEKQCPSHAPAWVKTARVRSTSKEIRYCLIQDLPTLVWAANLADLEMHVPLHRVGHLDQPDSIVFDLDPGAPAAIARSSDVPSPVTWSTNSTRPEPAISERSAALRSSSGSERRS